MKGAIPTIGDIMRKLKLKTTKYYPTPPVCTIYWNEEDWEKVAFYRTEPKKIRPGFDGHIWRTLGERDAGGNLLYVRAEKV